MTHTMIALYRKPRGMIAMIDSGKLDIMTTKIPPTTARAVSVGE